MNATAKNIVFDWNSTLLDDFNITHSCTNRLLESEGLKPVEAEDFRARYTMPFKKFYEGMGLSEAQIEKLKSLETSAFHDLYEPLADKVELRQGANEILRHVRKYDVKSYILSNHIVDPIKRQLTRFEIEHLIDEVLAYADRATQFRDMTKGERLRRYMNSRDMTRHLTLIVGDSIEEIEIAREQGLVSVAITGGCVSETRLRAAKPDHLIHSLHELKPILQERGFVS